MTSNSGQVRAGVPEKARTGSKYKWIALSNTTLGVLMATINQSIVLIALPDIFRGNRAEPAEPGKNQLLGCGCSWDVLVVVLGVWCSASGDWGDMFGRVGGCHKPGVRDLQRGLDLPDRDLALTQQPGRCG